MNRRSFFTKLGLAAASVAILPAATTYARTWVKPREMFIKTSSMWTPNPAWETAPREISWIVYSQSMEERYMNLIQRKMDCLHRVVYGRSNWEHLLIND